MKYQEHITQKFYWESVKLKTPLSYIMYIMDHEKISYKTLIQELSIQYNRLTLSYKTQQIHVPISASRQPASSAQSLQLEFSQMNLNCLVFHMLIRISTASCLIAWVHFTQITTDSQTIPSTCYLNWISIGSDMHVVNHGKSLVACEFTDLN